MIPRLIHQTWKSEVLPEDLAPFAETWPRHNPSWQRTLWTDEMLLEFVYEHYPQYFEVYCSYSDGVCRADAARYMLLHTYGGLYADIDVECLDDLSPITDEARVVLCHEPPAHWPLHAPRRQLPYVLFNGVMASPAGHPFWLHVLDHLPGQRHANDILDMTGPCLLTGAYLTFADKDSVVVHDSRLFTPTDADQRPTEPSGDSDPTPLTRHKWVASWWSHAPRTNRWLRSIRYRLRRLRHYATRGPVLDVEATQSRVDADAVARPTPDGNRVAILVPVRDAVPYIDGFVRAVSALDLPRETTKLVFCEGDSTDGTFDKLMDVVPALEDRFRTVTVLRKDVGNIVAHATRRDRRVQRTRRGALAVVRNHLIDHGLDDTDDWALWIDVDVWKFPADIFQTLRSANGRIVTPNCVTYPGGPSFDLNAFISLWDHPRDFYYRHVRGGLFQPPPRARGRLFLDCVRYMPRIELDGVGGTMLLVDASLHRGGLRFPELPYKDLIETEAFGVLARDVGVPAVGLPQVEILHVP